MSRGAVVAAGAVTGALALLLFRYQRGYPWSLAAVVGLAIGIWAGVALQVTLRLLRLWSPRDRGRDDDRRAP
jgi:hypothetical protein